MSEPSAASPLPPYLTFLQRGVLHSNSVVVHGAERFLLVDTGYHTGAAALEQLIAERAGRPIAELAMIANTHAHPDHTGGNAYLRERSGCEIVTSELDGMLLDSGDPVTLMRDWAGLECPSFAVTRTLAPGELLRFGPAELRVVEAAGHAAGEVSYHGADGGYLICGDLLWQAGFSNVVPVVEGLGGLARHERSLAALAALEIEVAVPGHGPLIIGRAAVRERIAETLATIRFFRGHRDVWARSNLKAFLTMHVLVEGTTSRLRLAARCRRQPWFRELAARFFPEARGGGGGNDEHEYAGLLDSLLDELLGKRLLRLDGDTLSCALQA